VPNTAAQPYKDRQVVEVLRDFQRQGVRIIFSTALVTPDMRVGEEPHGDDPQDIIVAMLAPHALTLRVGLRRILLVVRATSVVGPNAGGRAVAKATTTTGAIAGTVRDRATRHPVSAATVRVEGTGLNGLTRDDGRFRLSMVPAGARALIVQAPGYESLASVVNVSPVRTATVLLEIVRVQAQGTQHQSRSSQPHGSSGKDYFQCADSPASEASSRSWPQRHHPRQRTGS
jgi:hypothetical protein